MNSSFYDWYQPKPTTTYSKPSPPKKVVSIPVRFVRIESTRSESAVHIQKVFRGFMARLRVKQLMALKRDVDEVESAMSNPGAVEILRIDAMERLRLNERLMSLLLKLDSVRGTVSGVRDCRKTVIKKAIALQERIDAIAARSRSDDQTLEMTEKRISDGSLDKQDGDEPLQSGPTAGRRECEEENSGDQSAAAGEICNCENASESSVIAVEPADDGEGSQEVEKEDSDDRSAGEICTCCGIEAEGIYRESRSETCVEPLRSCPDSEKDCNNEDSVGVAEEYEETEMKNSGRDAGREVETRESGRKRTENEKLMEKMLENYEVQTRMMRLLTERVEKLERAFLCEKSQKMKRKERKKKNMLEQRRYL